ncbi:MAG: hypothetical protein N2652_07530 [Kiritimatiellae bacterium]|nr:hypothetical protein [Kiritimatiellia bacterium]
MSRRLPTVFFAGAAIRAAAMSDSVVDWGPLYYRVQLSGSGTIERAVGPLWERRISADGRLWALRPFIARAASATNRVEGDLLWPLGEFSALPPERGWRVLTAWYHCFDTTAARPRWRLWILPVYIQGRSAAGRDYLGVVPLGGRIEEFFGLDECTFVLWPVWSRQRDGHLLTTAWLYPIWSRTQGPTEERLRVFPFYGRARRHGQYEKQFILWPIWTWARYHYPTSHGTGWILFPFYGRLDLSDQTSRLILPPFIRITHGQEVRGMDAPWPFVRYQTGRRNRLHIWPFYGRTTDPAIDRAYFVWPLVWRLRVTRHDEIHRSWHIVPFAHWRSSTPPQASPSRREGRIWPLLSWSCEGEAWHWRAPELWPTWPLAPVERSWSPLWTLIRYSRSAGETEWELLWGLVRHRRDAQLRHTSVFPLWEASTATSAHRTSWSVLKGLVGVRCDGANVHLRLLYALDVPIGGSRPSSCTNPTTSSRR